MIPLVSSPSVTARARSRRARAVLAASALGLLGLSGCSFGPASADPQSEATASAAATQQDPAIVDDDGFYRANTLPEPLAEQVVTVPSAEGMTTARLEILSLDSDGTNARMVLAWLPPTDGPRAEATELVAEIQSSNARPWVRLVDTEHRTLIEPLQVATAGGNFTAQDLLASPLADAEAIPQRKAAAISSYAAEDWETAENAAPERTRLIYLDFPAPKSTSVSVLAGDAIGLLRDVPVSQGKPFPAVDELAEFRFVNATNETDPPKTYGTGATHTRTAPLELRTESVSGAAVEDKGEMKSLSVQADVLFALDADTLDDRAGDVITSTAEELRRSAKGQRVTIEGHTDDQGEDSYNQGLSERRAEAVKAALEPQLADAGITLETKGFGESQPAVPNIGGDGQPIEKNRALNRRVSFSYTPTADIDPNIATGRQLPDIPEMKPGTSDGQAAGGTGQSAGTPSAPADGQSAPAGSQPPIASGILSPPAGGAGPELQIDVTSLTEVGDYYALAYTFRTADGADDEKALSGNPLEPQKLMFGENAQTTLRSYATSANLALHDEKAGLLATPVTAGGADCLCALNGVKDAAFGAPISQFAYFPKQGLSSDTLSLRIAESGRLDVPVR